MLSGFEAIQRPKNEQPLASSTRGRKITTLSLGERRKTEIVEFIYHHSWWLVSEKQKKDILERKLRSYISGTRNIHQAIDSFPQNSIKFCRRDWGSNKSNSPTPIQTELPYFPTESLRTHLQNTTSDTTMHVNQCRSSSPSAVTTTEPMCSSEPTNKRRLHWTTEPIEWSDQTRVIPKAHTKNKTFSWL